MLNDYELYEETSDDFKLHRLPSAFASTWKFLHERWLEEKCRLLLRRQTEMTKDLETRAARWKTISMQPDPSKWRVRLDEEYRTHVTHQSVHNRFLDLSRHFAECLDQFGESSVQYSALTDESAAITRRWERLCEALSSLYDTIQGRSPHSRPVTQQTQVTSSRLLPLGSFRQSGAYI